MRPGLPDQISSLLCRTPFRRYRFAFVCRSLPLAVVIIGFSFLASAQTAPDQSSSFSGSIVDDRGMPVRGARLVAGRVAGSKLATIFNPQIAISDSNGLFTFAKLPSGLYRVCPAVPGSDLLDPCEWFPNPPAVFVQVGQSVKGVWVEMKHGKLLNVRLDDAAQNLKATPQTTASHFATVRVIAPNGIHEMPKVAEDANGQNHTIAIPMGVALKLDVSSPTVNVKGQGEAGDVNVNEGKSDAKGVPVPQTFQVNVGDGHKEFRFVVQAKGK